MAQATRTLLLSSFSSFFVDPPQPMAVRRCPKKKKKNFFWKKLNVIPEISIRRSSLPSPADPLIAVFEKSVRVVYVGVTPYRATSVAREILECRFWSALVCACASVLRANSPKDIAEERGQGRADCDLEKKQTDLEKAGDSCGRNQKVWRKKAALPRLVPTLPWRFLQRVRACLG